MMKTAWMASIDFKKERTNLTQVMKNFRKYTNDKRSLYLSHQSQCGFHFLKIHSIHLLIQRHFRTDPDVLKEMVDTQQLQVKHRKMERLCLEFPGANLIWKKKTTNEVKYMMDNIRKQKWKWAIYVARMEDDRSNKKIW